MLLAFSAKITLSSTFKKVHSGACGGLIFGGAITPDFTAQGVTPDLTLPPHPILRPPRIIEKDFFMLIILFLNAHVYLIKHYFLTAPGKNRWGGKELVINFCAIRA